MPSPPGRALTWGDHPSWGSAPLLELDRDGQPCERLVVVAAHPDDECLGAGGLIASAHRGGLAIYLVLLTAGEAALTDGSRHALATLRLEEMRCAVEVLAPGTPVVFWGATDGRLAECEQQVAASLVELVGPGERTVVVAPWRDDGHPDHDAAGRAAAHACAVSGARLLEMPIRLWLDRDPADAPWSQMVRLELDDEVRARKAEAIGCHASQMSPEQIGSERFAHLTAASEHYVVAVAPDAPDA